MRIEKSLQAAGIAVVENQSMGYVFAWDATFEIGNISTTEHDVIIEGYGFSYSSLNSYQFDENGDEAVYDVNVGSPMHLYIENANWENNPLVMLSSLTFME